MAEQLPEIYLALDRNYVTDERFQSVYAKATETKKLINGFIGYLRNSKKQHPPTT